MQFCLFTAGISSHLAPEDDAEDNHESDENESTDDSEDNHERDEYENIGDGEQLSQILNQERVILMVVTQSVLLLPGMNPQFWK